MRDWPQELREIKLANFRTPRSQRQRASWQSQRRGMDANHLAFVRRLPCTLCGTDQAIHAHHLRCGAAARERGIGLKCTDRHAISLCWSCHDEAHRIGGKMEFAWFERQGIDPIALADALWANRGNLNCMRLVLLAHREQATQKLKRVSA